MNYCLHNKTKLSEKPSRLIMVDGQWVQVPILKFSSHLSSFIVMIGHTI